jgi:hypothetical protein
MSLPQFTIKQVSENTTTTPQQIVRVVNSIINNLGDIFQTYSNKVQNDSVILTSIQLKIGTNQITHTLGRNLSGWSLVRQRGLANIYDTQDNNPNPKTYLQLFSSAAVSVDILVF